MRLFEDSEFADRIAGTKHRMEEIGVDVLLVASPANQFYLTGYDGWSFYTPQMVVVAADEDQPIWFGRGMDAAGARVTVFMDDAHIIPYPDQYVSSAERHPMQLLAEIVRARGWHTQRIGVEMEEYYYTARWHEILTSHLPDATFVDAFLTVNWVRMRKSDREIQYLMEAGTIASAAMRAAVDAVRPGVRQCDVMAELYRVTTGGTPEIGGTFTLQATQRDGGRGLPCAALELDRRTAGRERDVLHRDGWLSPSLPRAALALRLRRQADRAHDADIERDRRRAGSGPRRGPAGRRLRGGDRGVEQGDRETRDLEGRPNRVSGRDRLPADLG